MAADIAPAPCIALPARIQYKSSCEAAIMAPRTNKLSPAMTTTLRPTLSESIPSGI